LDLVSQKQTKVHPYFCLDLVSQGTWKMKTGLPAQTRSGKNHRQSRMIFEGTQPRVSSAFASGTNAAGES
jgi:hypothetical protein